MGKYRKKPVVIEAEQWKSSEESWDKIMEMGLTKWKPGVIDSGTFLIETLEGDMLVSKGDYIIKGIKGEFYPIKSNIFHETYEKFYKVLAPFPYEWDDSNGKSSSKKKIKTM